MLLLQGFKWLNKQGVKSSKGFVLQSVDRWGYHYIEGDHVMRVDVEPCRTSSDKYYEEVYLDSFTKWMLPHDGELVSPEKSEAIRKNVETAMKFMKVKAVFKS